MALPSLPAHGFITRLLQQSSQLPTTKNQEDTQANGDKKTVKPDQTNISNEARQANGSKSAPLESKLIALYNQKGEGES